MPKNDTPHLFAILLILFFILVISCSSNQAEKAMIEEPQENKKLETTLLKKQLDSVLNDKVNDNLAGTALLVMHDNEVVYSGVKGMANIQNNIEISSQTGFRLASITKTFTALAIMQLLEQERLSLDDRLTSFFPNLSNEWNEITIHHLLSHRSGIPDYINDISWSRYSTEVNTGEVMEYLLEGPQLKFSPDTSAQYSNSGYFLLAQIVSEVTGISFSDYMQEHFYNKFGMEHSYIFDEPNEYDPQDALSEANNELLFGKLWLAPGASSQVSSTSDFAIFFKALMCYEIIKKETLELMIASYSSGVFGRNYGYGLLIDNNNPKQFGHEGILGAFTPAMRINIENDWQVIVLNNGGGAGLPFNFIDIVARYYENND